MVVAGCSGDWTPPAGGARVVFVGWRPGPGQFIAGVFKNTGPATAYRVTIYTASCGQHDVGSTVPDSLPPGASGWILEGPCHGVLRPDAPKPVIEGIRWSRTNDPREQPPPPPTLGWFDIPQR